MNSKSDLNALVHVKPSFSNMLKHFLIPFIITFSFPYTLHTKTVAASNKMNNSYFARATRYTYNKPITICPMSIGNYIEGVT